MRGSEKSTALIRTLRPMAHALKRLAAASRKDGEASLPNAADAGVAHGRAGIGFALSRWADSTGDEAFRAAAAELIRFDLEAIDARQSASTAFTQIPGWKDSHLGWCRGWLGAALMALQEPASGIFGSGLDFRFRRIANDIISAGTDGPLCLCHGALGYMDFLAAAAKRGVLDDLGAAAAWRSRLLARLMDGDWVADSESSARVAGPHVGTCWNRLFSFANISTATNVIGTYPRPRGETLNVTAIGRCRLWVPAPLRRRRHVGKYGK